METVGFGGCVLCMGNDACRATYSTIIIAMAGFWLVRLRFQSAVLFPGLLSLNKGINGPFYSASLCTIHRVSLRFLNGFLA